MEHGDHVMLLRKAVTKKGGTWAEFGSGRGAFTLALAELVGNEGEIYSVDKNGRALEVQEAALNNQFPVKMPRVHFLVRDYTLPIDLPALDGLLMANSLHFQRDKEPVLEAIYSYLSPGGCLVMVEYNIRHGNPWVPYPLPLDKWKSLVKVCGLENPRLLVSRPSSTMGEIYSAVCYKPANQVDGGI